MKVYINPDPTTMKADNADGGIRRIAEAQLRHLPKMGIEVVGIPEKADIIHNHGAGATDVRGIPIIHSSSGLMWSRYDWGTWAQEINQNVIRSMKIAVAHTACSEWVATALRRGMLVNPEVVYHGIEPDDWSVPEDYHQYVLWNKARRDAVSDPADMVRLAHLLPNVKFMSTMGVATENIEITGALPYPEMKSVIQHAGLYLATARETFGIGTLEALASGVPVVGWDWGGQTEIIKHGETGYLAPPGNFEALAECVRLAIADRPRLSVNARQDAIERWTWEPRIQQYANLYQKVLEREQALVPKVSVIMTAHNLGKYIGDALKSVQNQTMRDWECIIVDDQSTDGTKEIAENFVQQDPRFRYLKTPTNLKLSMARNFGVMNSTGRYLTMLDADDMMDEETLRILSDELGKDKSIHIAFGHLDVVNEEGGERKRGKDWPWEQFDWRHQMAHLNQLPYCSMMRREVFERSGGYRARHWRAEDAAFWCRVTSFGFVAKKVTERALLIYRIRANSKSRSEPGDGDWTQWFPWRIAGTPQEGFRKMGAMKSLTVPDPRIVPFGAQGEPAKGMKSWYVHDFAYPRISVVIPVGPGHEKYVIDAIESVVGQTYIDWEVIVVNDTGIEWPDDMSSPIAGAPFVKLISTGGNLGVAAARNLGFKHAKGEAFFPLDADDYILPTCLERMAAHMEAYDGIIYSGWLRNKMNGDEMDYYQPNPFECGKVLQQMWHSGSSILIPRWLHEKVGGWDTEIPGWEDWDYLIAAQSHGACSYPIDEPLFVYRFFSGTQREKSYDNKDAIKKYIDKKWYAYRTGEKKMGCGCKAKVVVNNPPASALSSSGNFNNEESSPEMVLLEYHGIHEGPITIAGPVSGTKYRFGRVPTHVNRFVRREDAQVLLERVNADGAEFVMAGKSPELVAQNFIEKPMSEPIVPEFPVLA